MYMGSCNLHQAFIGSIDQNVKGRNWCCNEYIAVYEIWITSNIHLEIQHKVLKNFLP